jgi:hypothetical protein
VCCRGEGERKLGVVVAEVEEDSAQRDDRRKRPRERERGGKRH